MDIIGFILHIDQYLAVMLDAFGAWTYVILFLIIFAETGLVVTPFLPGDSLLFAVGALAGGGFLDFTTSYLILLGAAILGDTVNYWIGHQIGPKVFSKNNSRLFNKAYLEKTRGFYEKHGGKTIIIARFMPIIRTFAPFVAGIGRMHYTSFLMYNVIGAFVWVTLFTLAGYFFGGMPFIKQNFEIVIIAIIFLSLIPMIIEYIKHKRGPRLTKKQLEHTDYQEIRETLDKKRY